MANIIEVNQHL